MTPTDDPRELPKEKWKELVRLRSNFIAIQVPYACRCLLEFVQEAERHRMWEPLGYASLREFLEKAYGLNPQILHWTLAGLKLFRPDQAVSFEDVATVMGSSMNPEAEPKLEEQRTEALVEAVRAEMQALGERLLDAGVEAWFRREGIDDHLTERKEKVLRRLEDLADRWEALITRVADLDRLDIDVNRLLVSIVKEAAPNTTEEAKDRGGRYGITVDYS